MVPYPPTTVEGTHTNPPEGDPLLCGHGWQSWGYAQLGIKVPALQLRLSGHSLHTVWEAGGGGR